MQHKVIGIYCSLRTRRKIDVLYVKFLPNSLENEKSIVRHSSFHIFFLLHTSDSSRPRMDDNEFFGVSISFIQSLQLQTVKNHNHIHRAVFKCCSIIHIAIDFYLNIWIDRRLATLLCFTFKFH